MTDSLEGSDFDATPRLRNGPVASYEWGCGDLHFSPLAEQHKRSFVTLLAGMSERIMQGENREELLSTIALIHEYRHFQQDFGMGVGCWDYVRTVTESISTFNFAKHAAPGHQLIDPLAETLASHDRRASMLLVNTPHTNELEVLREVLKRETDLPEAMAGLFTTRRLLEADAVIYTYRILNSLKYSKSGITALNSLRKRYSIFFMPEAYRETIIVSLQNIVEDLESFRDLSLLDAAISITAFAVSLALARPDPETQATCNLSHEDVLPGVKYIRMLCSLHVYDRVPDGSIPSIEEMMLANAPVKYPRYLEIGAGWKEYLKTNIEEDVFPAVTARRLLVLERKFDCRSKDDQTRIYNQAFFGDPMSFIADFEVPLFMKNESGNVDPILFPGKDFDNSEYFYDRKRLLSAARLARYVNRTSNTYECPYDMGFCSVRQEKCERPYTSLHDLPLDEECRIRQFVEDRRMDYLRF